MALSASSPRRIASSLSKSVTPRPLPVSRFTSIIIFAPSSPSGVSELTSERTSSIASSIFEGSLSNVAMRAYISPPSVDRRKAAYAASVVRQLLVPVAPPSLGRQVEQVPDRLERPHVTRVLVAVRRCVEELRAPEVPDRLAIAVEDVEHRTLVGLRGLGQVVAVVAVGGRGEQAQIP